LWQIRQSGARFGLVGTEILAGGKSAIQVAGLVGIMHQFLKVGNPPIRRQLLFGWRMRLR